MSYTPSAAVARLTMPVGVHRNALKILVMAKAKGGKSRFAASLPKPIFALDCGTEGGIGLYLEKDVDHCFAVNNPTDFEAGMKEFFSPSAQKYFRSFVGDTWTVLWSDWMDHFSKKFGGDISGPQWNVVKRPWKEALKELNRCPQHVCLTARIKDILYEKVEKAPGLSEGLNIRPIDDADVEKNVPYIYDLWFKCEVELDKLNRRTNKHIVTLYGARVPPTMPPDKMYTGQKWTFNAKNPPDSIFQEVIKDWEPYWGEGAAQYIGPHDPRDVEKGLKDMIADSVDTEIVVLQRKFKAAEDLASLAKVWEADVIPLLEGMTVEQRDQITGLKDARKVELAG